jgi:hypothetical protein
VNTWLIAAAALITLAGIISAAAWRLLRAGDATQLEAELDAAETGTMLAMRETRTPRPQDAHARLVPGPSSLPPQSPPHAVALHVRHERCITLAQAEGEAAAWLERQEFEAWEAELAAEINQAWAWFDAPERCWAS